MGAGRHRAESQGGDRTGRGSHQERRDHSREGEGWGSGGRGQEDSWRPWVNRCGQTGRAEGRTGGPTWKEQAAEAVSRSSLKPSIFYTVPLMSPVSCPQSFVLLLSISCLPGLLGQSFCRIGAIAFLATKKPASPTRGMGQLGH